MSTAYAASHAAPAERRSVDEAIERIDRLSKLMDEAFTVPVVGRKFGLDSLIGLIPGVGDLATAAVSLYIIREAALAGVPKRAVLTMLGRTAFDTLVGSVPVVGDAVDFFYKANRRNAEVAKKHLTKLRGRTV